MSCQKHAIFDDETKILLAISGKHHLLKRLPLAVPLPAADQQVALVRIWLGRPPEQGDCLTCTMAGECHHRERCLHLVATCGHALGREDRHWERTSSGAASVSVRWKF